MDMLRILRSACAGAVAVACAFAAAARAADSAMPAAAPPYEHPFWRIARLAKPPVIDGVIHDDEYAGCPALTGMVTYGGSDGRDKSLIAAVQQVTWYVGYDDQFLYISMRSPHPKGTWPRARIKEMDNGDILWDDHTEIQIATRGRQSIAAPGKGFYKIMHNAKGFWRDEWLYNGTPGTESAWNIGGDCRSSVTPERWDMEMSIALGALREKSLDGKSWVLQLLRADAPGGVYFAGWVGEAWMSWTRFGEVLFDPAAPVFRFLRTGEAAKGDLDLGFEVVGGQAPGRVRIAVAALDPEGKELTVDTQERELKPGQKQAVDIRRPVAWAETGANTLAIRAEFLAADAAPDAAPLPLYDVRIPVRSLVPPAEWAARVKPWLDQKPQSGLPAWRFAYWASYGVADASIDLDFFGMDEAKLGARQFTVEVLPKAGGAPLASATGAVTDLAGRLEFATGDLPEGDYSARIHLLGADGKTAVFEDSRDFRRRKYPWEGNTLGTEDVLLPPFTAIVVDAKDPAAPVLKPCLRDYTAGPNALPARIVASGGARPEDILSTPVRFEVVRAGQAVVEAGTELQIVSQSPTRVKLASTRPLGDVPATLAAEMEYDGWWDVRLTLPAAPGTTLERLTLVLPLWPGADTMYVQRGADTFAGYNRMDAIPAGEGVVWDSSRLGSDRQMRADWGTFVPILYAGNGDKGLWWFAEEWRDWTRSDTLPTVQYVRTPQGVEVRIHLLAAATALDRERRFHFALLADPVKKMEDERKWAWGWGGREYAHETFGWREWGRSHDGYYMTDADRTALRECLQGTRPFAVPTGNFAEMARRMTARGGMVVLYGSTSNMMLDLPEFDTFSGEWVSYLGGSFIPKDEPKPKPGKPNMQGSYDCNLTRDDIEVGCNWTPSQVQCFLWYHEKLLRDCPVNGTWWDNGSSNVIRDYDPARQAFYLKWNVFVRREVCKRLNTIGWRLGRTPWWINNLHVDWSFNQVSWHIENDYYVDGPTNTLLDQMTVDNFRAYARLKRGIVHRLASRYGGNDTSTIEERRRRARCTIGLCLLHDIGTYRWDDYAREMEMLPALLHQYVGFFNEEGADACEFIGYWRAAPFVKVETPDVYVSVYRNRTRAVLVVLNSRKEVRDVKLGVLDNLLGRKPRRLFDAETGAQVGGWAHYEQWDRIGLEPHGLRLLVVE